MAQQNQRARQQQRQRLIIILLLILVVGVGAYYFIALKQDKSRPINTERPPGKVAVPVMTKPAPLGSRISSNMFTVRFMKPSEVPVDAILVVDEFLGRFVTRPLYEGNYIRMSDVAAAGAVGGYSALAKPGKRLVVLDSKIFPGAIASLRVGDRVDLLAIGDPNAGLFGAQSAGKSLADNGATLQGGGSQPGDPNSPARQRARARAGAGANIAPFAASATLVAEDAEVMRTPSKGVDTEFLVLQMAPQDAHVTMLMAASGTVMRVVFRPFNDETRLTQDTEAKITTRLPRPAQDPDAVIIISGNVRALQRPNSKMFESENKGVNLNIRPNNSMYSDTKSSQINNQYNDETILTPNQILNINKSQLN